MLRRWFEEDGSRDWESKLNKQADHEDSHGRIPFQLWNVGKYGSCVDAAITGLMAPPLLEFQVNYSSVFVFLLLYSYWARLGFYL